MIFLVIFILFRSPRSIQNTEAINTGGRIHGDTVFLMIYFYDFLTISGMFNGLIDCISVSSLSIVYWFSVLDRGPIDLSNAISPNKIHGWTPQLLTVPCGFTIIFC